MLEHSIVEQKLCQKLDFFCNLSLITDPSEKSCVQQCEVTLYYFLFRWMFFEKLGSYIHSCSKECKRDRPTAIAIQPS